MRLCLAIAGILVALPIARAEPPEPAELARRIDAWLAKEHRANQVQAAPRADDYEFLRRVSLDLTGRIPKVSDVRAFAADKNPSRRASLVASLLESPRHATHFATTWRSWLTPEIAASGPAGVFKAGFEAWLYKQFRTNRRYDALVYDLLTTPIASDPQAAEVVFRDFGRPNALAFFAVKDAAPENLAAVTARMFLGVQLECAQCHDHPFARWTREQFWNQAAFFAGIERQGSGIYQPLIEVTERRVAQRPDAQRPGATKKTRALFLDGQTPTFKSGSSSRQALAAWITAAENPFFARATVNRIWGQFFGVGIVEPVDNFHDDNKASHPELLDELAEAFTAAKCDLNYLITAICLTEVYQRTSARTHVSQDEPRLFARMQVKALTGEQFFDSLAMAIGYREPVPDGAAKGAKGMAPSPRIAFLTQFALRGPAGEQEFSVQQALSLMHGRFVGDATSVQHGGTLTAVVETPYLQTQDRVEILYLATLGRPPSEREAAKASAYIAKAGATREPERLADVFWALLNSAEFRLNH
jgi:hypothetical protein